MLRVPPGIAHADDPAEDPREPKVRRPVREDLPVCRLVREESHLGEQDAESGGDKELEPAVAQQEEARDAYREAESQGTGHEDIEDGCAIQEACFPHHLRKPGV
ncbi:hypothetical protein ABE10_13255 [Bacillus toyonensis]|nr:hypothetical protein [Bacillus toyonensis]